MIGGDSGSGDIGVYWSVQAAVATTTRPAGPECRCGGMLRFGANDLLAISQKRKNTKTQTKERNKIENILPLALSDELDFKTFSFGR